MANSLENLILRLLSPNNEALAEGFGAMREAFKDPGINVALCECMTSSQNAEVRKYAAVLLRKKFLKARQWKRVPSEIKQGIKSTVLQLFINEADQSAHASVTQLIAIIAKHEFLKNQWPELMALLNQCMQSNTPKEKEMGLYAMSIITTHSAATMKPYLKQLLSQLSKTLEDVSAVNIPFHTIECLTNVVSIVGSDEMNQFQALVPLLLQVIRHLVTVDEVKGCKAMEVFDELIECEVAVIAPHIKPLIGLCLEVCGSASLQPNIRVKALSIIMWLAKMKQKTILKHKLVSPILDIIFPVMCQPDGEDEENDELSPVQTAGQVIDTMALHLPPEKLLSPLMHHFERAFKSDNPYVKKGGFLAMAVIAEGCSEYIRTKYLQHFLEIICKGMKEENSVIRNAALYCFGQYAEHLQPDISKYASELLPVLFEYLNQTCHLLKSENREPPTISFTRTFYALEIFCEHLENELLPFLPGLMELLMSFLTTNSFIAKEHAITAIGAVASAVKGSFVPYFPAVIEHLKLYISEKTKENMALKIQSIDTLGQLARTVGNDIFMPIANDCMVLGLALVDQVDDPDLRRCVYNLFSALAAILKKDMAKYLEVAVNHMVGSMQSTEGINAQYVSDDRTAFTLFENEDFDEEEEDILSSEEDEDEDGEDITGFSVENAFMDEKEAAIISLRQISTCLGVVFVPYLDKCFEEVKKLLDSPSSEIRREVITCLGDFCVTLSDVFSETASLEYHMSLEQKISTFLPKLFATAREDTDRQVVLACLETLQEMVEKIKKNFVNGNTLESIVALMKDVFKHKLACQGEEGDDEELDDQEAEYDTMLFEYAGDIIPSLVKTVPSLQFAPYLAGLLPFVISKTKRSCTESERSFSIGTLADTVNNMEPGAARSFVVHLLPVFLKGMTDDDKEVRSNSVFGLGVLIENVTETLFEQYPAFLQALSNMLSKEQDPRSRDNICSTVAKMIKTNVAAIPLKQVFPALLQCLPLQVDMDENKCVYQCLALLHSQRCDEFFQHLPSILKILSQVLCTQEIDEDTRSIIYKLIKDVHSEFPNDFDAVLKTLPPEGVQAFGKVFTP